MSPGACLGKENLGGTGYPYGHLRILLFAAMISSSVGCFGGGGGGGWAGAAGGGGGSGAVGKTGSDTAAAGFGCGGAGADAADSAAVVWAASERVLRTRVLETSSLAVGVAGVSVCTSRLSGALAAAGA